MIGVQLYVEGTQKLSCWW